MNIHEKINLKNAYSNNEFMIPTNDELDYLQLYYGEKVVDDILYGFQPAIDVFRDFVKSVNDILSDWLIDTGCKMIQAGRNMKNE